MQHLKTYQPIQPKLRLGRNEDGGYVICDGLAYGALISCGICDEVSFEVGFLARHPGIPAFGFDGTVAKPSSFPDGIEFNNVNIAPYCGPGTTDLKYLLERYNDVFMKMDIEGHEWRWLLCLEKKHMLAMKQVVLEVHGLWDDGWHATVGEKEAALEKLADTHWLVHVHANNNGRMGSRGCPYVLELTYVRKDVGMAGPNRTPFPIPGLDYVNNKDLPDIAIGSWPFVTQL